MNFLINNYINWVVLAVGYEAIYSTYYVHSCEMLLWKIKLIDFFVSMITINLRFKLLLNFSGTNMSKVASKWENKVSGDYEVIMV